MSTRSASTSKVRRKEFSFIGRRTKARRIRGRGGDEQARRAPADEQHVSPCGQLIPEGASRKVALLSQDS